MKISRNKFDINDDLLIRRYRGGIILERPTAQDQITKNSIKNVFSMPFSSYFYNANNQIVGVNDVCLNYSPGAQSSEDCKGSSLRRFANKETCAFIEAINTSVYQTGRMQIVEEAGCSADNIDIQALSFKFPWYANDEVIGLFGCSILATNTPLSEMANLLTQLVSIGILGNTQLLLPSYNPLHIICTGLTKRQNNVLSLLLRGKTSKETGKFLGISYRTVESHIENIKSTTGCRSKSELFDKFA